MINVELKTTEPMSVVYVTMTGEYSQTPEAFGRVYGWAAQHGLQPAGMPMAVYLTMPGEGEALWEVWAPVAGEPAQIAPDESGCGVKRIPAQLVASTVHRGPYETVEPTYRELGTWVEVNGYAMAGPPAESYLNDPSQGPPEEYLTEILFPVIKV